MTNSQIPAPRGTLFRRAYVFLTVALGVFVTAIATVGVVCHGYDLGVPAKPVHTAPSMGAVASANQSEDIAQESSQARQAAQEAFQEYQAESKNLVHFVSTQFVELSTNETPAESKQDAAPNEPLPSPPPAAKVANPLWTQLHDQLDQLQQQRAKLLKTLLPSHPSVRFVDLSIAEVEAQLKATPADAPAPMQPPIAVPPAVQPSPVTPAPAVPADRARWREAETRIKEISERINSARKSYLAALARVHAASQQQLQAAVDRAETLAIAQPAITSGKADARLTIGIGSLAAILVGIWVARGARISEVAFEAAADVRQRLDVTVLGLLPTATHVSPREQPLREPRRVGRAVMAAELCLAAAVTFLVVTAILDRQFFHDLMANPLAACSQRFWC